MKKFIQRVLRKSDLTFIFTKADGSIRTLQATNDVPFSDLDAIESNRQAGIGKTNALADTHIRVYEKGLNQWRTIRIDSIIDIEVEGVS